MTPVEKNIICVLQADLIRSHTDYPQLVMFKISLVFPSLCLLSLEATDCKGHFNSFCYIYVTAKNMEYFSFVSTT